MYYYDSILNNSADLLPVFNPGPALSASGFEPTDPKGVTVNVWLTAIFLIVSVLFYSPVQAQLPKVLIISSYDPSYEWTSECEKGIKNTLIGHAEINIFYMDTKRIPEPEFTTKANLAWTMFIEEHPDLVMVGDDNALRLVGPRLGMTQTPMVFYGINNNPRIYFEKIPTNMTGILERTPILPLIRYIRQINPNVRSALVMMDKSQTSASYVDVIFKNMETLDLAGIQVTYKIAEDWSMWKNYVQTLTSSYDILVASTYQAIKRDDGSHVNLHEVIEWTSAHSPLPIFTNQEYSVYDTGAAGAFVTVGETHGRQAAEIALKILDEGKRPEEIPTETDRKGALYFNWKQLERFNLTLPEELKKEAQFR